MRLRAGFTLIELSMVLLVSGLMVGFLTQIGATSQQKDCYASTQVKLPAIREAIEVFVRKNDRLPFPAARNIGIDNPLYGREDNTIATTAGVKFGALPFQTIGLSPSYAGDCWGNKFTYMVTAALTSSSASGGFLDTTIKGNISRRSTTAIASDTEVAYAIISHGIDELGSVELNYSGVSLGWCAGATSMKNMNCRATAAEVGDSPFNDGFAAAASYYDDIVLASGKPKIIAAASATGPKLYCWGDNSSGELGDNTTTDRLVPTAITTTQTFAQVSAGRTHTCALDTTGAAYCWGDDTYGQLGNGAAGSSLTPTAVSGGLTFSMIRAGDTITCGLTTAGAAYCWGYNGSNLLGAGALGTPVTTPAAVTGGHVFTSISADFMTICAIKNNGVGYCWGDGDKGRVGDNNTASHVVTAPRALDNPAAGAVTYYEIQTGSERSCGRATNNKTYCWGKNDWGQLGDGSTTNRGKPTEISGGHNFRRLALGGVATCGLNRSDDLYCWGVGTATPTAAAPGHKFERVAMVSQYGTVCGIKSDFTLYCWGSNTDGQAGNGTIVDVMSPTLVAGSGSGGLVFGAMSWGGAANAEHICAIQPLLVSWGENDYGQVGDGTTTRVLAPKYITPPSTTSYLIKLHSSGGSAYTRCGIGSDGKAYCWGENYCGQASGSAMTDKTTPTAIALPSGVTSFTSVKAAYPNSCGIGNNNKLYCWGLSHDCGDASPLATAPYEITGGSTTVSKQASGSNMQLAIGTNGLLYYVDVAGWPSTVFANVPYTNDASSPALPATAKDLGGGGSGAMICIHGTDNHIYCNGEPGDYGALGDGHVKPWTTTPAGAFVRVTLPAGVTSWKQLSMQEGSGSWGFACAIGNNDQLYCWGEQCAGKCGNGPGSWYTNQDVPTLVTNPSGVSGWKSVSVGSHMVTGVGNDGEYYWWGFYNHWSMFDGSNVIVDYPTKLTPPAGASGYIGGSGPLAIVY